MLPDKESLTVEFKSDVKKLPDKDIFETVVALANTDGGNLYLGIEDDGKITGLHNDHRNTLTLAAFIANNTVPPVSVQVQIIEATQPVLKISVPRVTTGIVATASGKTLKRRLKPDGTPESAPMYPHEFPSRLSDLRKLDFSGMPIEEARTEDFSPEETERLRRTILERNGDKTLLSLSDEDLFKALGLTYRVADNIVPTVAGLLLLGKREAIERHLPTAKTAIQILTGTSIRQNDTVIATIAHTVEKIESTLQPLNPEEELDIGPYRMAIPAFNPAAVREAVVNAFCHRDYSRQGNVRIAFDSDGLTVSNPGGFMPGVTIRNLLSAEPLGRNPALADALKRIGLAERTGRGIDRIYEGSLLYGKPLPDYSKSTETHVTLYIPRAQADMAFTKLIANEHKRLGSPISVNVLLVLNYLKDHPFSKAEKIAKSTHVFPGTVKNILDTYFRLGLVTVNSQGLFPLYALSRDAYPLSQDPRIAARTKAEEKKHQRRSILTLAKSNDVITRADVSSKLGLPEKTAYLLLRELTEEGKLTLVNTGRYARYRLG